MATSNSYTKNTWADDDPSKPLSATRMSNLETQADAAYTDALASDAVNLAAAKAYTDSNLNDSGWIALTLATGMNAAASPDTPSYRIKNGVVYLQGSVMQASGNFAGNTTIATLPSGARPTAQMRFPFGMNSNFNGQLYIPIAGTLQVLPASTSSNTVNLAGINFVL